MTWFGFFAWLMLLDPMLSSKCRGVFATSDILVLMSEILAPVIQLTTVLRFVRSPFSMRGSMFFRIESPKIKFWSCFAGPCSLGVCLSWCVVWVGLVAWGDPVEHVVLSLISGPVFRKFEGLSFRLVVSFKFASWEEFDIWQGPLDVFW